jgi:hypothetical protein
MSARGRSKALTPEARSAQGRLVSARGRSKALTPEARQVIQ